MGSKKTMASPFKPMPRVIDISARNLPLDTIGDVHGCADELMVLLHTLGHKVELPDDPTAPARVTPADGRGIAFVGDLTDRGPRSPDTLRIVEGAILSGRGFSVIGNHDSKLLRALAGQNVQVGNDLQTTLDQMATFPQSTKDRWRDMIHQFPHQLVSTINHPGGDGLVTIVHAAAPSHHQGQETPTSFSRGIYGYADGQVDKDGNLKREDWALEYEGTRTVVHGHTPLRQPRLKNRVLCIDTGAVFGGHLCALSTDTMTLTQVASHVCGKVRPGITRDVFAEREGALDNHVYAPTRQMATEERPHAPVLSRKTPFER